MPPHRTYSMSQRGILLPSTYHAAVYDPSDPIVRAYQLKIYNAAIAYMPTRPVPQLPAEVWSMILQWKSAEFFRTLMDTYLARPILFVSATPLFNDAPLISAFSPAQIYIRFYGQHEKYLRYVRDSRTRAPIKRVALHLTRGPSSRLDKIFFSWRYSLISRLHLYIWECLSCKVKFARYSPFPCTRWVCPECVFTRSHGRFRSHHPDACMFVDTKTGIRTPFRIHKIYTEWARPLSPPPTSHAPIRA